MEDIVVTRTTRVLSGHETQPYWSTVLRFSPERIQESMKTTRPLLLLSCFFLPSLLFPLHRPTVHLHYLGYTRKLACAPGIVQPNTYVWAALCCTHTHSHTLPGVNIGLRRDPVFLHVTWSGDSVGDCNDIIVQYIVKLKMSPGMTLGIKASSLNPLVLHATQSDERLP